MSFDEVRYNLLRAEWNDLAPRIPGLDRSELDAREIRWQRQNVLFGWLIAKDIDMETAKVTANTASVNGWEV